MSADKVPEIAAAAMKSPKPGILTVTATEILTREYGDPVPIVEGLLYAGVTLFAGRPKVGKSWFTLDLARSVAQGARFLNRFHVPKAGSVLYLALEESAIRTHNRLKKISVTRNIFLDNLKFAYSSKPLMSGGGADLDQYLTEHPTQMVVIDTFLALLQANGSRDVFRSDYAEVNLLTKIARKHGVAILLVHHLRKAAAQYGLDAVAGTTGVSAAADAVWTLQRQPGGDCMLEITGREMENDAFALKLATDGERVGWQLIGTAAEAGMSIERKEIIKLLGAEGPLRPAKVAEMLRKNGNTIRGLMNKLALDAMIQRQPDGRYTVQP